MQVGAVFGLIFALIVMGFVLMLGTGQIAEIFCLSSVGQTSKAVKNLETVVDQVYASSEGSSDTIRLSIASSARVCFLDPRDPRPNIAGDWMPDPDTYPVLENRIQTGGYNVWIEYNCGSAEPGYVMDHIVTPHQGQQGNFCARAGETILVTNVDTPDGVRVMLEKLAV